MNSTGFVDDVEPGLELAYLLLGIHADDEVGFESRIAAVAGWERVIAWATAMQAEQLVAIDVGAQAAEYDWDSADRTRSLTEVLGLALKVSGGSAVRRLNSAETLLGKTPAVHDALKVGAITTHHARVVTSAAADLPVEVAQQAAAATMVDDSWRTPVQCRETFARHVLELDPDGAADRARAAAKGRRVTRRSEPDGMASLWALLPAEDCAAVYDRVDACARSSLATNQPGDERTLDARRVDALVQLVLGQIPNGHRSEVTDTADPTDPAAGDAGDADAGDAGDADAGDADAGERPAPPSEPTRHGRKATVHVTVAWSTLIGLDDRPAHLAGYGPVDAATARRIAADPSSTWIRLLTDPVSGTLLDHGRTKYRPPQDLQDFVMARDRCCRFPGCERVAAACDLDHRRDWDTGGTTCADCLDCLCRRHHLLKHQGGWTHRRDPATGDSTWTDPSGNQHLRPATILPTPEPVAPPRDDTPPTDTAAQPELVDVGPPPF